MIHAHLLASLILFSALVNGRTATGDPHGPLSADPGLTRCTVSVADGTEDFAVELYWFGPPAVPEGFRMAHTMTATGLDSGLRRVFEGLEAYYGQGLGIDGYLVTEDMDFDGYRDLRLMLSPSAGPNTYWYFFLFKPGEGIFERASGWEEAGLVSPSFDQDDRTISCFHRDGMGLYGSELYRVEDGMPVLVRSESTRYTGPDSSVTTVRELVDGRMIITETIVENLE